MVKSHEQYLAEVNALFFGKKDPGSRRPIEEAVLVKDGKSYYIQTNKGSYVDRHGKIVKSKGLAAGFTDKKAAMDHMKKQGITVEKTLGEETKGGSTEASIQALQDTDYRDASAYFKMVQLLKGLASVADEDEMANSFLSAVSDALSDIVWDETDDEGDGEEDEGDMEESLGDTLWKLAQEKKRGK